MNTNFFTTNSSSPSIGEVVTVLKGSGGANFYTSNVLGNFVQTGGVYLQADYPNLYANIGLQNAAVMTPVTSGTVSTINVLTYGNGLYVYGGADGVLATSTDSITWTQRTSGTSVGITGLAYGNGIYVSGANGASSSNAIKTSTDAITWTARTFGSTASNIRLLYGNGIFVATYGSTNGRFRTSTNGITWSSPITVPGSSPYYAMTYGNGLYVAAGGGGGIASSTDAITWTARTSGTALTIFSITYGNGLYVYGGDDGVLATSTDTITWTSRTSGAGIHTITALTYDNGLYAYSTTNGSIATSTDAVTWTYRGSGTISSINAIVYNGSDKFVVGADGGGLFNSSNLAVTVYSPSYDVNTQFYVPNITVTTPTFTSNVGYQFPALQTYMRAK
jgi:hypothetical protein